MRKVEINCSVSGTLMDMKSMSVEMEVPDDFTNEMVYATVRLQARVFAKVWSVKPALVHASVCVVKEQRDVEYYYDARPSELYQGQGGGR